MITLKQIQYNKFQDALELCNDIVKLVVTVDAGPRILFYGFKDGQNFMHNFAENPGPADDGKWHSYGGHRFWYAPETAWRTYYPDNVPVDWTWENNVLTLNCPDEESRWIGKKIIISLDGKSTQVKIDHVIKNIGLWPLEVSAWAITALASGGCLKVPMPDYVPHGGGAGETFLPVRTMAFWPFTRMDDPRIRWKSDFFELQEDSSREDKIKLGMLNEKGYVLYELNGETFRKDFDCIEGAVYPDMNCNCEFYTQAGFLEAESLSPVVKLPEGGSYTHTEYWILQR